VLATFVGYAGTWSACCNLRFSKAPHVRGRSSLSFSTRIVPRYCSRGRPRSELAHPFTGCSWPFWTGQAVHLSTGCLQPIASDDVAAAMTEVALGPPVNGTIEIAGPERAPLSEFVGRFLKAANDPREVVADAHAPYFGLELDDRSLLPGDNPRVGAMHFDDWLGQSTRQK
jgi:hypothetical protein